MLRLILALVLVTTIPRLAWAQAETPDNLGNPRGGPGVVPLPPPGQTIPSPREIARSAPLEGEAVIPSSIARRLRILSTSLDGLALRGGSNIGDGITSLVSSGVGFAFGALAKKHGDTRTAKYLFVFGSVGIAQAGLAFARPRATGYASRFSVMPMTTDEEVIARLEYGEDSLHHLARVHRALRFTDASLAIGASLGTLPLLLGNDGFDSGDEWDWVIIVSAGLSATMGIVSLIQRSDAERRWHTYCELTEDMENETSAGLTLRGVAPYVTPNGFGSMVDLAF
jgi:hypothetical protein